MEIIEYKSWGEFEHHVAQRPIRKGAAGVLYRGQRRSEWHLETTLDRKGAKDYSTRQYQRDIQSAARVVETVTGKKWNIEDEPDAGDDVHHPPQGYAFMAYLRQNGFPSPLLDWTRSPYVGAFFAFYRCDSNESKHVSIFEYDEMPTGGKSSCSSEPTITSLGPWIATDKKHFLQQSEYTVCRKHLSTGCVYAKHQDAFNRGDDEQDLLTQHLLPSSERDQVLQRLKLMNITAFSLFETTESLMDILSDELFAGIGKD